MDYILWCGEFTSFVWDLFFYMFGILYAHYRDNGTMMKEFFLNPARGEKSCFFMACRVSITVGLLEELKGTLVRFCL